MSDTYRGKPYKYGFIDNFSSLPQETVAFIADDLGLYMTKDQLLLFRNSFVKQDRKYTIDEIYMADAFFESLMTYSPSYSISRLDTDSNEIIEAYSDIMDKRRALCDRNPVTVSSLISVYNRYLECTGYDDNAGKGYSMVPTVNTLPAAQAMKRHTTANFSTGNDAPYAIAPTDRPCKYNTSKKKIAEAEYKSGDLALILIKIPEYPLAYESLADILNASAHLSADILYASAIGAEGLFSALLGMNTGFSITFSEISAMMPEITRPHMLAEPMSAALMLAHPLAAENIISLLSSQGFEARKVGTTHYSPDRIYVNYGGYFHMLDAYAVSTAVPLHECVVTLGGGEYSVKKSAADGISVLSFRGCDFSGMYKELSEIIRSMNAANADARLLGYICMPHSLEKLGASLERFLAVYRAFAENAIPIRTAVSVPEKLGCAFCVIIADANYAKRQNIAESPV